MNISGVPGGNDNNIPKTPQIQNQQIQNEQNLSQNPQVQNQETQKAVDFRDQFDYSSRPSYMNKSIFKNDRFPGINMRINFGDIISTMAQAGKPSGVCGGSFMAIC